MDGEVLYANRGVYLASLLDNDVSTSGEQFGRVVAADFEVLKNQPFLAMDTKDGHRAFGDIGPSAAVHAQDGSNFADTLGGQLGH